MNCELRFLGLGISCWLLAWGVSLRPQEPLPPADAATWLLEPQRTEIAWERAVVADARKTPLRDYVLGHLHWQRVEQASVVLAEPSPPVAAYRQPMQASKAAWESWEAAAEGLEEQLESQGMAPVNPAVARRNAARAQQRWEDLREAENAARERQQDPPPPDSSAESEDGSEGDTTEVAANQRELTSTELAGLQERLRELQDQKRRERMTAREGATGADW